MEANGIKQGSRNNQKSVDFEIKNTDFRLNMDIFRLKMNFMTDLWSKKSFLVPKLAYLIDNKHL